MDNNDQLKLNRDNIGSLIQGAKNIAVIPSKIAGFDAFCAGVALNSMLKALDKNVTFIYPGKAPDGVEDIITPEEITADVKQRSLLVSIDYSGTEASKVNYSTENDILYLKITPITPDFNKEEKIKARVTGYDFDLIFVLGAQNIYDLGHSYKNLDTVSKISKLINIDITNKNERFGFINIIEPSINSLCLLVLQKSTLWGLIPNEKTAKAILKGIVSREPAHKG